MELADDVITGDVISEEVVTETAMAEEVMAIETIPNDVISSDVTEIQMEAVKMECDDALDQPSTSKSNFIQSEASKSDDQTETFFIGANELGLDVMYTTTSRLWTSDDVIPLHSDDVIALYSDDVIPLCVDDVILQRHPSKDLQEDTITEIDLSSDDVVQEIDSSSKNEFFEKMFAKRMRRKICPKPGGKDALESQNIQPFRKPDRRFKHRNPFKNNWQGERFFDPFLIDRSWSFEQIDPL